ncbi:MAG: FAD binding domain-containing protein [Treponema sp.]|nr:FAD binding domain-containing protein [Treponema sp.]
MSKNSQTVLLAKNLQDILYHIKTVSGLHVVGGCTEHCSLGEKSVTIRSVPELKSFEKRERSLDVGPAVTLSTLLDMGRTNIPTVLYDAISTVATPAVRNIATIGGNICAPGNRHTLWAPLLALDARLEFRSQNEIKSVPFRTFTEIPAGCALTRIRIPLIEWEMALFRRVGPEHVMTPQSAGFVFLADAEKNIITNVRIAYAGAIVFRSRDLENRLIGARLPLPEKTIDTLMEDAEKLYDTGIVSTAENRILRFQFLNLLRYALEQLS